MNVTFLSCDMQGSKLFLHKDFNNFRSESNRRPDIILIQRAQLEYFAHQHIEFRVVHDFFGRTILFDPKKFVLDHDENIISNVKRGLQIILTLAETKIKVGIVSDIMYNEIVKWASETKNDFRWKGVSSWLLIPRNNDVVKAPIMFTDLFNVKQILNDCELDQWINVTGIRKSILMFERDDEKAEMILLGWMFTTSIRDKSISFVYETENETENENGSRNKCKKLFI